MEIKCEGERAILYELMFMPNDILLAKCDGDITGRFC